MTLLDYAFLTEPDPLQATTAATLTLVVSNSGPQIVTCTSMTVTLPVGTNTKDLTASPAGISTTPPTGWRVAQSGGAFTLTPQNASAGKVGRDGLAFIFANVAVNDQIGTCAVRIDEVAALPAEPSANGSTSIALTKFPAQFTVSDLTGTPKEVTPGGSAVLMWTGTSATYTMTYDPDGQGPLTVNVSNIGPLTVYELTNAAGVTFTLEVDVTVPGQDAPLSVFRQFQVDVAVPKPVIETFTGTLSDVFTSDATAELNWSADGRDVQCAISGCSLSLAATGSLVVPSATVARAASYTLTAQNINGSVSSELDIHWAPRVSATSVDAPLNIAIARDGSRAYVCCNQSLVAFDMTALEIVGSPTSFPQGLSVVNVSPDGTLLYLTSADESTVTVLDAQTLAQIGAPIALVLGTGGQALLAAISPDGSRLFVPAGFGYPEVAVVDLAKRSQIATITVDAIPVAAAVSPDGTVLLVSNGFAQSLSVIDTRTNQPIQPAITLPGEPKNVVFSPDGTGAYVAYFLSGATAAGILAIDVKTLSPIGSPVTIGDQDNGTFGLAVSPDGSYVLCGAVGKLYVLQTNPFQLLTTIDTGGADASDVQISPDGTVALVAAASANALVIVRLPSASGGVAA
jgi:YVTN family beta-propeller protein